MPLPDLREASRGEEQHDLRCHEDLGTPLDGESHLPGRASGVYRDSGHGTLSPPPAALQPLFTFAYQDPVLIQDSRVFRNMLEIEEFYLAASNYFQIVQQEIKPNMRQIVTSWMLEVCMDQNCHANVFLLSCNIMDRFLSQLGIKKSQFQLVAAATMFIASKLADPCPITGTELVRYTNDTYNLTELLEMELLILSKLKWDLSAVTPYDFLEHLLRQLQEDGALLQEHNTSNRLLQEEQFKKNTERIILNCAQEFRFSLYTPSMLSSAAIATAAALGMNTTSSSDSIGSRRDSDFDINELVRRLQILTRVDYDYLVTCINEMHENLGVESRESLRRDHSDQSSRDSTDTKIPNWDSTGSSASWEKPAVQKWESESSSKNSNKVVEEERESASGLKSSTPTEMFGVVDYLYST